MRRTLVALIASVAVGLVLAAPAAAKEFGFLYADGATYRTFGTPALVEPGTGTDPLFKLVNSTNSDQLSVAQYPPGDGSHGGRWAIWEATWVNEADRGILVTSFEELQGYVDAGRLTLDRIEEDDFRCPILPGG